MPRNRDSELLKRVGVRLSEARRAHGWSQEQLAAQVDVAPLTISRFERGLRAMSLTTLYKISEALAVPLRDLLDVTMPVPAPTESEEDRAWDLAIRSLPKPTREMALRVVREMGRKVDR